MIDLSSGSVTVADADLTHDPDADAPIRDVALDDVHVYRLPEQPVNVRRSGTSDERVLDVLSFRM